MTALPSIFLILLLLSVFLLGLHTLRQSSRTRKLQRELEQLKEALRRSREYAEQQRAKLAQRSDLDSVKDEFISTVSHELRTPLTSIRGALGLLSAGLLGDLDLERMESGRAPLKLRRCSMFDLAREAVDTMTPMADGAGVRLELTCNAPRDSIYFDADSDRILQVMTNLLSNAIKFSPAASTISVEIDSDANSLLLKVVDEGRGIPADKLESVFDRFQQVESSDASKKGGTGLGLAICRSIIQQHGGAIWAQPNHDGPGTMLWVQLSRSARASDAGASSALALPAERGEGLILVCDDDPGIRVVVAEQLRQHGYDILEAGSGEEAVALANEQSAQAAQGRRTREHARVPPISAILLDLYMPGLSGWETLQRLKVMAVPPFKIGSAIPVVILSVVPPTDHPLRAGGPEGWVQKPFNENLLLAELGRVLRTHEGPGRILLVEEDGELAHAMVAGFEEAGLRLDHAASLRQAVDRCMVGAPDLIILNLTLPDGDGFSLVDWLRRQPTLQSLPLVVYSGREISQAEMAKLRLGPTEFLDKAKIQPREVEELVLAMVQRLRNPAASPVA